MKNTLLRIFITIILGIFSLGCFAQTDPTTQFTEEAPYVGLNLRTVDNVFENSQNWTNVINNHVDNRITLSLIPSVYKPIAFNCNITFQISYKTYKGQVDPNIITQNLEVNYNPVKGAVYKSEDYFDFSGGYDVTVLVTNITSNAYGTNLPAFFKIENRIIIDRQYTFEPNYSINLTGVKFTSGTSIFDQYLKLTWPYASAATEYDLEWTTIDNESENTWLADNFFAGGAINAQIADIIFKNNATRITTFNNDYSISLIYDAKYILARIRRVQYNAENVRVEGDWNYTNTSTNTNFIWLNTWHQPTLNWQYSNTLAEDGKNKEIVSYFDGTLRNRQTVTLNAADKVAVVQETIFDDFGRPIANILPTPFKQDGLSTTRPFLNFQKQFNLNSNNQAYSANDFTVLNGSLKASPLNSNSGAAKYYSSNNNISWQPNNKYVPDAEQYPLSVTTYTPDKTGRIKTQGGVGPTFQAQSINDKLTKYYYGKPEQWELDQLFGNDVGFANHYLKNMVMDPNGQLSISYLNASGKTIATALAGIVPTNTNALSSAGVVKNKIEKILEPNQFSFDLATKTLSATTVYLNNMPDSISLNYDLEKLFSAYPNNLCTSCQYELNIQIKSDAGIVIYKNATPIQLGNYIQDCNNGLFTGTIPPMYLKDIGEYYISFTYQITDRVLNTNTDNYIFNATASNYLTKQQAIVMDYLQNADFGQYIQDCNTCGLVFSDKPEDKTRFTNLVSNIVMADDSLFNLNDTNYQTWINNLYNTLKAKCDLLKQNCLSINQQPISLCDKYKIEMLNDITPGGQYALFNNYGQALEPSVNILSNYYQVVFRDVIPAELIIRTDGSQINTNSSAFTILDVIIYWKADWAEFFLQYHPEYCLLEQCISNSSSLNWDQIVKDKVTSITDLSILPNNVVYGYNSEWLLAKDPFFAGSTGAPYYQAMKSSLENYNNYGVSLAQFVDYAIYSDGNTAINSFVFNTACPRKQDRELNTYKTFYLQLKETYLEQSYAANCTGCKVGEIENNANCPPVNDFILVDDDAICGNGTRAIKIVYTQGLLPQNLKINLYSPYTGLVPTYVDMLANEGSVIFCVPDYIASTNITISGVDCGYSNGCDDDPNVTDFFRDGPYDDYNSPYYGYKRWDISILPCVKTCDDGGTIIAGLIYYNNDPYNYNNDPNYYNNEYPYYGYGYQYIDNDVIIDPITRMASIYLPPNIIPSVYGKVNQICIPACNPIYQYKISRFKKREVNVPETGINYAAEAVATCVANADSWMQALEVGLNLENKTQQEKDLLRQEFINICSLAGNSNNINGASSLPNGITTSAGNNSFGDAIKQARGIPTYTTTLNPWLIEFPLPNGVKQQTGRPTIVKVEPNLCAKITQFTNEANLENKTLYNYLLDKFGNAMILTQAELDEIVSACNNSATCSPILNNNITLPLFLDPNHKGYITKAELLHVRDVLMIQSFGSVIPTTDPNYETIYANFVNQYFGFGMPYYIYENFTNDASANFLVNKLSNEIDEYNVLANYQTLVTSLSGYAKKEFDEYIIAERQRFKNAYVDACSVAKPNVKLKSKSSIYHYTLYYYDQAGNLIRTIPPAGVNLLSEIKTNQVALARTSGSIDACTNPITNTLQNKPLALEKLSQHLADNNNNSIEFWLYNAGNSNSQTLLFSNPTNTSNKDYMLQMCIKDGLASVDIYSINQSNSSSLSLVLSNHLTIYTNNLNLAEWNHVVIQGTNLKAGTISLYINGGLGIPYTGSGNAGCSWSISDPNNLPENITNLKYLRFYNKLLSLTEIKTNAKAACFAPFDQLATTYRFNIPLAGSATTVNGTTTESLAKTIFPGHFLNTSYAYNGSNQVLEQSTPDAGKSTFYYDEQLRLIASQNAKQFAIGANTYSYTKYDNLDRIIEVGQKVSTQTLSNEYLNILAANSFLNTGTNSQITKTFYDLPYQITDGPALTDIENIRKRVTASVYTEDGNTTSANTTFYSYDIAGNVKTLWQKINGLDLKRIDYQYDLISGKVNMVAYQHNQNDRFYYKYKYDAENRLTESLSGINAVLKPNGRSYIIGEKLDAAYKYYFHGPLARMELGDINSKVQGIDYAYTLQGWLKGMNSTNLSTSIDIGKDGLASGNNAAIPKDIFGYALHYYGTNDYKPTGGNSIKPFAEGSAAGFGFTALYNGNIAGMSVNNAALTLPLLYTYKYDQLNRLNKTFTYQGLNPTTNNWNVVANQNFRETYSYDANGNILTLLRNGNTINSAPQVMDNLTYSYNKDANGNLINNKLRRVVDGVTTTAYTTDIDSQTSTDNYTYDAIGNLTKDLSENINTIDWNVYGKIKSIIKTGAAPIVYSYDASGNRVGFNKSNFNGGNIITDLTWYVRDAQGNAIATYVKNTTGNTLLKEVNLYGSSRLGNWSVDAPIDDANTIKLAWQISNKKQYELSNHLGNVMATISGDYYVNSTSEKEAVVLNAQDYYAFGSLMPGRTYTAAGQGSYRYGFNGKENDNEVKGEGNQQDYGMRIYDPRLGRFLSIDPLTRKFAFYTPYQFAGNTPIQAIDLDGMEPVSVGKNNFIVKELVFKVTKDEKLINSISSLFYRQSTGDSHKAVFDLSMAPSEVFSVAPGKIFEARKSDTYGNLVITEHKTDAGNFYVLYAHLSKINLKEGEFKEGASLGISGNTGKGVTANKDKPLGFHLHLEVYYLPENEKAPKNYDDLIIKRNSGELKRFNPISKEEVEKDSQGNKWLKEKAKSNSDWNEGKIPIEKLLPNLEKQN